MSDSTTTIRKTAARPVSLGSVIAVFFCLAAFLLLVYFVYLPLRTSTPAPYNIPPENAKDEAWRSIPEERKKHLAAVTTEQETKAKSFPVPIDRAMELTVAEINAAKKAPAAQPAAKSPSKR